jgi:Sec-independent protein secretion pathway component TatC
VARPQGIKHNFKIKNKVIRTFIFLVLLVLVLYFFAKSITNYTGFSILEDKFESCLREKDIDLYVKDFDSLNNLKTLDYISYFEVHRCKNRLSCMDENISEYPTWIIEDKKFIGNVDIFELADITGCEMI